MASTEKVDPEQGKEAPPSPKPISGPSSATCTAEATCFKVDVALRVLLFASTVAAIVVLVTSKQTVRAPFPLSAKFNHSPAFIYFLVALSIAGLYSLVTTLGSISVILKPEYSSKFLLYYAIFDVVSSLFYSLIKDIIDERQALLVVRKEKKANIKLMCISIGNDAAHTGVGCLSHWHSWRSSICWIEGQRSCQVAEGVLNF
ncbi:CASP-like protein 1D1 isoform X1 [Cannabis sativa]|uniref:CASP-like protein 1D1 isoform X1 n=1 Tax=Cannabis sativa TaxID=3483 RepID=UPI0029CA05B2|nr:CASP-like protein 1D1 isoform X1 [Cannabis sativa]